MVQSSYLGWFRDLKVIKQKANVNVYLLLFKEDNLLLSFRQNTGYEDGKWSLLSGHVESNESATAALIREAKEEIGIEIKEADLTVAHVMHRKTDRENIDIFMVCKIWGQEITNKEPEKCGGVKFFNVLNLPENTIDYILKTITHIENKEFFSEEGWVSC